MLSSSVFKILTVQVNKGPKAHLWMICWVDKTGTGNKSEFVFTILR